MNQPADIDPEILAVRALQAAVTPGLDVTALEPAAARLLLNQMVASLNDGQPELPKVETFFIEGPAGKLRARLYQPAAEAGRDLLRARRRLVRLRCGYA
jgi:hypothetical protein